MNDQYNYYGLYLSKVNANGVNGSKDCNDVKQIQKKKERKIIDTKSLTWDDKLLSIRIQLIFSYHGKRKKKSYNNWCASF